MLCKCTGLAKNVGLEFESRADFFASIIAIFVSSINRLAKTTLVGWEKGTCGGRKSMLVGGKASWWGENGKFSPSPPTRESPGVQNAVDYVNKPLYNIL